MLHLVTFGGLALESVNEAVAPRLSAQRLAILAVLAAEGDRRVTRERLTGLFWPEADEERARHSLRQALYTLRQEIGREVVRSDFVLSLDAVAITSDVAAFRAALARGDRPAAGKLARGPFLDGFYLPAAPPFQRWVEEERGRLHTMATGAIVALASEASAANDLDTAIGWWRQLTELDPLSGRFALGYAKALAARGDRAEALAFIRVHAALVRRELETEPDPELNRLDAGLRSMPVAAPPAASPRPPDAAASSALPAHASVSPAAAAPMTAAGSVARKPGRRRRLTHAAVVLGLAASGVVLARTAWGPAMGAGAAFASAPNDATTRSAPAYRLYQEGVRAYYALDPANAKELMRAALRDDSTFAMAAYYDALLTSDAQDRAANDRAFRLAEHASERERRLITTDLSTRLESPSASAQADTLLARWPDDPRVLSVVGRARFHAGDWPAAASALERAAARDSAVMMDSAICYVCDDLGTLTDVYFWWDSLPAAKRTAERYARLRPASAPAWQNLAWSAVRTGDTAGAGRAMRRIIEVHQMPVTGSVPYAAKYKLLLEMYDTVETDLRALLASPKEEDVVHARWLIMIALRNQGRLREAAAFNETSRLASSPAPLVSVPREPVNDGQIALERGDAAHAASAYARLRAGINPNVWLGGFAARNLAWTGTLLGMAFAAVGDTAAVLQMADTVEYWGQRSLYGRDRRAHHYLRGMAHAMAGRDDDAIRELRQAISSPTLGFTRVNYELGRVLLRRDRPREAVDVLAPALRGEVDASNLYVTRTELHELLADAYARLGVRDSAAVHYAAVVRAWEKADPRFQARRESARAWLSQNQR
jgi:DNA-binding SARP family transcriptional activator